MLKPTLSALKMIPLPEAVPIPMVSGHFDEQGEFQATDQLNDAASGMLGALRTWVDTLQPALQAHRSQ